MNAPARDRLAALLRDIRACRACEQHLPHEPRPVLRAAAPARILIAGQAPGRLVHETGIPWNDPSGDRLRQWLQVDRDAFYDESRIAIVPMGYCYPGRDAKGGDLPPRKECSETWHARVLELLPNVELTLLFGQYSHRYYLGDRRKSSLTDTVRAWREYVPQFLPMPHPSWRNQGWLKRNPWFESEILPYLRRRVHALL